jgi:hypothetical protein
VSINVFIHKKDNTARMSSRKTKGHDANHVRFKDVAESEDPSVSSSDEKGSRRNKPPNHSRTEDPHAETASPQRPLSVQQSVPFSRLQQHIKTGREGDDDDENEEMEEKQHEEEEEEVEVTTPKEANNKRGSFFKMLSGKSAESSSPNKRGSMLKSQSTTAISVENKEKKDISPSRRLSNLMGLTKSHSTTDANELSSSSKSPKRTSIFNLIPGLKSLAGGSNNNKEETPTITAPVPITVAGENIKRNRLQTIFEDASIPRTASDVREEDLQELDKYRYRRDNAPSGGREYTEEENEEKLKCFHLFEIAESITNGQMMKIKTGVAGNLPVQDSFPLFKSFKHYLVLYWSIALPQDDWSLAFFDECIDENYFANNFFGNNNDSTHSSNNSQHNSHQHNHSTVSSGASLLRIAKKIIPLSEVSEVFLDQKTTTSFRFYRGQEVTHCTPLESSMNSLSPNNSHGNHDYTAAAWADAIYAILQLQSFPDDELLKQYYEDYFYLSHPELLATTNDSNHDEEEKNDEEREEQDNNAETTHTKMQERQSFNSIVYHTQQTRMRADSSASKRSNNSGEISPTSPNSNLPFKKRNTTDLLMKPSTGSSSSTGGGGAGGSGKNKRGSVLSAMKNLFKSSSTIKTTEEELSPSAAAASPKKVYLFEPIEDEQATNSAVSPGLKRQQSSPSRFNFNAKDLPEIPMRSNSDNDLLNSMGNNKPKSRRWSMFTNNMAESGPKRNKNLETSIPLSKLAETSHEDGLQSNVLMLTKKKQRKKKINPTLNNGDAEHDHENEESDHHNGEGGEQETETEEEKENYYHAEEEYQQQNSSLGKRHNHNNRINNISEQVESSLPSARSNNNLLQKRNVSHYNMNSTSSSNLKGDAFQEITRSVIMNNLAASNTTLSERRNSRDLKRNSFGRGGNSSSGGFYSSEGERERSHSNASRSNSPRAAAIDMKDRGTSTVDLLVYQNYTQENRAENEEKEEKEEEVLIKGDAETNYHSDEGKGLSVDQRLAARKRLNANTSSSSHDNEKEGTTTPKKEFKTPAKELGTTTILDYLYEQSKSPLNKPQMKFAFNDTNRIASSIQTNNNNNKRRVSINTEMMDFEKMLNHEKQKEHYDMMKYQKLHQELKGIRPALPSNSPGNVNNHSFNSYSSFPADKTEMNVVMSSFSPSPSPSPTTNWNYPMSPSQTVNHQLNSFITSPPKVAFTSGTKKKKQQSPKLQSQSQETEDSSCNEETKTSPKQPFHHHHEIASPLSITKEEREGRIRDFLKGNSSSIQLPNPESTEHHAGAKDKKESNKTQGKSSSILSLAADTLFSFSPTKPSVAVTAPTEKKLSVDLEDDQTPQQPQLVHSSTEPVPQETTNKTKNNKRSVSPKKKAKKTSDTNNKKTAEGVFSSPSSRQTSDINTEFSSSLPSANKILSITDMKKKFQNSYHTGMVSDSEESLQRLSYNKNSSLKASSSFRNDHSIVIEREKEKKSSSSLSPHLRNNKETTDLLLEEEQKNEEKVHKPLTLSGPNLQITVTNEENKKNEAVKRGSVSSTITDESRKNIIPFNKVPQAVHDLPSSSNNIPPPPQASKRSHLMNAPLNNNNNVMNNRTASPQRGKSVSGGMAAVAPHGGETEEATATAAERMISPMKDRPSLRRIFGSVLTQPFDYNDNTRLSDREYHSSDSLRKGKPHPPSITKLEAPLPTSTVKETDSRKNSNIVPSIQTNDQLMTMADLQILVSPPLSPTVVIPSFLTVYYYQLKSAAPDHHQQQSVVSSPSPYLYYKYPITLSLLTKLELKNKLMTSKELITNRAGIHYSNTNNHNNSSGNKAKNNKNTSTVTAPPTDISILTSNIIIAELLESSHYIQFHYKRIVKYPVVPPSTSSLKRTNSPLQRTNSATVELDEFVFVPIEGKTKVLDSFLILKNLFNFFLSPLSTTVILAIDFDAQLSGLFRFLLNISNHSFPIIYSHSSNFQSIPPSYSSSPTTTLGGEGIFREFLFQPPTTLPMTASSSLPYVIESILKAQNVVELQIWLQYMIHLYNQTQRSMVNTKGMATTGRNDSNKTSMKTSEEQISQIESQLKSKMKITSTEMREGNKSGNDSSSAHDEKKKSDNHHSKKVVSHNNSSTNSTSEIEKQKFKRRNSHLL